MLCPFSEWIFPYVKRGGLVQKFHRTRYGLAVTSAALAALGLTTGMSSYKSVDVVVDGRAYQGGTFASESIGTYLRHKGIRVSTYDLVEPARTTLLQSGMKIVVKTATAVSVKNGAKPAETVHTFAATVGDLLTSLGIRLAAGDSVSVLPSARIRSGMHITVTRRESVQHTEVIALPFTTVRQANNQYAAGADIVSQSGQPGEERLVTRKLYVNGRLVARRVAKRVLKAPVPQIVQVGTAVPSAPAQSAASAPSRSDASLVSSQVLTMVATAYSMPGSYTATGAPAGYGDIAVDPSVIPLGTKLYIPGYGYGVANDTGGAIQGYRIDLCFNSVTQAIDWGRQVVKVYILGHN